MNVLTAAQPTTTRSLDLPDAAGRPVGEVFDGLASSEAGLDGPGAAARRATFGPNRLPVRPVTGFGILLGQLRNPRLILLLAAAVVSAFTGGVTDAGIVNAIVVLSVGVGFVNAYRSAGAVAALHGDIHCETMVWRDGRQPELDVSALVPGDVGALRVGDVIPADLRIGEADQLECAEAVLTGESMAAAKTAEPVGPKDSAIDLPSCASWARRPSGRGTRRRGLDGLGDRVRRDRGRAR
jgi:Mg2+-importing ATPase